MNFYKLDTPQGTRQFIFKHEDGHVSLIASPTEEGIRHWYGTKVGEPVNIVPIKYIHPHLFKELKCWTY